MNKMKEPLRRFILFILTNKDMCGYEIRQEIKNISDRFHNGYVPSFGSIYPALKILEKEKLIESYRDGKRIKYKIKPKGRNFIKNAVITNFDQILDMWPMYEKICKGHDMVNIMKIGYIMRNCPKKSKGKKIIKECIEKLEDCSYEKKRLYN